MIFTRKFDRKFHDWDSNYTEHPSWENLKSIQSLATARDPHLKKSEIASISIAIEKATEQYWSKLLKWMNQAFEDAMDNVIISGGGARFLQPELETHFNCEPIYKDRDSKPKIHTGEYRARNYENHSTLIIWGAGLQSKVKTTFDLENDKQSLSYRLVDAYGLFNQLLSKNSRSSSKNKKNSSSGVKNG